jgi:hypothetical protein
MKKLHRWTIDEGGEAFPACNEANNNDTMGMTLRDYFAAKAMIGIMTNQDTIKLFDVTGKQRCDEWVADQSYQFADAMIAERNKAAS